MTLRPKRLRRRLLALLLVYLAFDLRPLLLVPNLVMSLRPVARFANGTGTMEMRVFPRLCVAGDPIRAVIHSTALPLGGAFARSYDRSGIFPEFEFSGSVNSTHALQSLYWTMEFGGGLGGNIDPGKVIFLNDYVHFDRVGRYRLHFRYRDREFAPDPTATPTVLDYDLGTFSIIYFPENPVSKLLKQAVLAAGLFGPFEGIRDTAARWLGYQETAISTYALTKYFSLYWARGSAPDARQNSVFWSLRGVVRNFNFPSVGRILKWCVPPQQNELAAHYFRSHCARLIWCNEGLGSVDSLEHTTTEITQLVEHTFPYVDQTSATNFATQVANSRTSATDDALLQAIARYQQQLQLASNQTQVASLESNLQWAKERLAKKRERARLLQVIDYTLKLLETENRTKPQSP